MIKVLIVAVFVGLSLAISPEKLLQDVVETGSAPSGWNPGGKGVLLNVPTPFDAGHGYVQFEMALSFNITSYYPSSNPTKFSDPAMNLGTATSQTIITFLSEDGPQFSLNQHIYGSNIQTVLWQSVLSCNCSGVPFPYQEIGQISFTKSDNITFETFGIGGSMLEAVTSGFMAAAKFNITGGTGKFKGATGVMSYIGWTTFNPMTWPLNMWASFYVPKSQVLPVPPVPLRPADAPPNFPPPFNGIGNNRRGVHMTFSC